jgi:glycosyltransferase involved in cell wall biosynthesis
MPLVSILLPAFNAAAHLQAALDSLFRQSLRDFELLVIDDASEDDTPAILKRQSDPRLRVLRNERRLKLSGALNRGLHEVRGEFVARMDADDIARPRRLEWQAAFLRAHPSMAICGGRVRRFGSLGGELAYPCGADDVRAFSLFNCPFAHPAVMLRRSVMEEGGFRYDGSYYPTEDYELWTRMLDRCEGANLPGVLLDYRVHGSSMTGGDWSAMDDQAVRVQARLLGKLGLAVTPEKARFHRDVAMARIAGGEDGLARAEDWLLALRAANRAAARYEPAALDRAIHDVWFRVCMACASRGLAAAGRFVRSPAASSPARIAQAAIVGLSAWKARRRNR